jgi:hypothetical protein
VPITEALPGVVANSDAISGSSGSETRIAAIEQKPAMLSSTTGRMLAGPAASPVAPIASTYPDWRAVRPMVPMPMRPGGKMRPER